MLSMFEAAFAHDEGTRVIILEGDKAGAAFCAGFDITRIDDDEKARGLDPIESAARAIEECALPVMAAIEGPAFGGGLELAAAASIRLCSEDARFCMPPAKLGLAYSLSGLTRLQKRISRGQMQRLFLSAEIVGAQEAKAMGLVEKVCENLEQSVVKMATQIANNAPRAVRAMRFAIEENATSASVAERYREMRDETLTSFDLQEGVRAFKEGRAPHFVGK